ncbi:MAG: hypothetical protein AAF570_24685, partial [Bacteroidota bacterium]
MSYVGAHEAEITLLGGDWCLPLDFSDKAGVLDSQTKLDAALHCGGGLAAFLNGADQNRTGAERILVTEAANLRHPDFQQVLKTNSGELDVLISVNRVGELEMFVLNEGRRRSVTKAKLDLETLLFPKKLVPKSVPAKKKSGLHAFFDETPAPLLFPALGLQLRKGRTYQPRKNEALSITSDMRLLYFFEVNSAAIELKQRILGEEFRYGKYEKKRFVLSFEKGTQTLMLYVIDVETRTCRELDFTGTAGYISDARFHNFAFIVRGNGMPSRGFHSFKLSVASDDYPIENLNNSHAFSHVFWEPRRGEVHDLSSLKRLVNNGYSTFRKIGRLYPNQRGRLSLGKWELIADGLSLRLEAQPRIADSERVARKREYDASEIVRNHHLRFRRYEFNDGSEVILDPRGYLHFRSASGRIPDFSIGMILEEDTAAWSADGHWTGNETFG